MKISLSHLLKILLIVFSIATTKAQTIEYTYDKSGNRTSRKVILLRSVYSAPEQPEQKVVFTDLFADMNISIYPNPTKGQLIVQIMGVLPEQPVNILVYNMSGVLLQKKEKVSATTDIDISNQPTGTYIMKIVCGESTSDWKIIKE